MPLQLFNEIDAKDKRIAGLVAERDAIKAHLDKYGIAMPGGSTNWTLEDRVKIACLAAVEE